MFHYVIPRKDDAEIVQRILLYSYTLKNIVEATDSAIPYKMFPYHRTEAALQVKHGRVMGSEGASQAN